MKRWFYDVQNAGAAGDADLVKALDAIEAYTDEYPNAKRDLIVNGSLERLAARIPGIVEHRRSQLFDLEAIIEYLEQREKVALMNKMRWYLEHYQRTLSDKTAKDYADVSDEVQLIRSVKVRVGNIRDMWLAIDKGIEFLHFQITNVTKLRCAGLEEAEIDASTRY